MPKYATFSRRDLFRAFGGSAMLLYPILAARTARADTAKKKRFIAFTTSSGVIQDSFWPTGTPNAYSLAGTSLEPLTPFISKLALARGINNNWGSGDSHSAGMVALLTGNSINSAASKNGRTDFLPGHIFAHNASIDQLIAANTAGQTTLQSLVTAIQPTYDRPSRYCSYAPDGSYLPQSTNPYTVFASVFQPLLVNCSSTGQSAVQHLQAVLARRKSVLDAVLGDLSDASRLAGLNGAEKAKLEAYTTSLHQLETSLQATPVPAANAACTTLSAFSTEAPTLVNNQNYAQIARLMLDLIVAAFQLDVTRVATIVWDVGGSNGVPSIWENYNGSPIGEGYHDLTHQADPGHWRQKCAVIDKYHAGEFAYLLGQLQASSEGDGSILDNSLALWSSELGDGAGHSGSNIPVVLAGTAGGSFASGRYLQFTHGPSQHGMLLSILQAMGVQATSVGNSGTISPLL